ADVERVAAHITHHADDLTWHAPARDKQGLADRILVAENLAGARLADEDHVRMVFHIAVVEFASAEDGDAPRTEISWGDIVGRRDGAMRNGQDVAIGAS